MARSPAWIAEISAGVGKLRTSVGLFFPRKLLLRRFSSRSLVRRTSTSPGRPTAARARLRNRVKPDFESVAAGMEMVLGGSMVIIVEERVLRHQQGAGFAPLLMILSHI